MKGIVWIDAEVWPLILERLPRPLLREEAAQDLRWWDARGLGRPSIRQLAQRWGWISSSGRPSTRRVRRALADQVAP